MTTTTTTRQQIRAELDWCAFEALLELKDQSADGPAMRWSWALAEFKAHKGRPPLFDVGHAWMHRRPVMRQLHPCSEPCLPVRPAIAGWEHDGEEQDCTEAEVE